MFRLAIPVLIEQLLVMLVVWIDTFIAARYLQETRYIAAIGVMAYILWMIPCTFGIVAIGSTALTARFVGAGDFKSAARTTNQSLLLGVFLALLVTLLVFLFGDTFLQLLGMRADAAEPARRYLRYVIPVIPAMMVQQVGIACLRGAGDTMSGFITMAIVNTVNAIVGITLATGLGPFPQLGWDGLAIGTISGYVTGGIIVFVLLIRGRAGIKLKRKLLKFDYRLTCRILKIGIPGGMDQLFLVSCHIAFLMVITGLGNAALAAHSLGIRIESLAYLPGSAFHVAAATMTGQYLGAGKVKKATRSALMATAIGGSLMIVSGFIFYFGAELLTGMFVVDNQPQITATLSATTIAASATSAGNPSCVIATFIATSTISENHTNLVATLTIRLLQLVAFSMPSLALMIILSGALRGAGDTRWPLIFACVGLLGIRIPLALWLAQDQIHLPLLGLEIDGWGLGVIGAWYAMIADVVLRSLMITARFWHGGWQRIKV